MRVQSQFIEMFNQDKKVSINEMVDTVWGTSPSSETYNEERIGMPFYQGKAEFGDVYINDAIVYCSRPIKIANKNEILMSVRAPVGAVNIAKEQCCIGRGLAAITPKIGIAEKLFIFHALRIIEDDIDRLSTGSTFKAINKDGYNKITLPMAMIDKQRRFVAIAEQADKSKFVGFKSQFIEMFSSYQTTPVGNYIEDSYPGEWGTEDKDGNGVKVVRTTNFTNSGKLDLTDVVTRSISEKKVERKTIRKYDTILERSGGTTDNPVGRVVLFEEDEQYLCNNFTQVLRFKKVDPIFAFYSLFYFYHTNKIVVRSMGSKTTGIQNLNMSKYLEIGIPNASDDEQKKFVAIAKQADKSKYYN